VRIGTRCDPTSDRIQSLVVRIFVVDVAVGRSRWAALCGKWIRDPHTIYLPVLPAATTFKLVARRLAGLVYDWRGRRKVV
jgi:hypothetical protein